MRGIIEQWKDDKGFGFFKPDDGSEKIFFHISSVKTKGRRPKAEDIVLFESEIDSRQRKKAKHVVIEGVTATSSSASKLRFVPIEPPRKNALDYFLILIFICSLAGFGFVFLRSGQFEFSWYYGIPAVIAIVLLNRNKKPKEKSFTCYGCNKLTEFDKRIILAWNRGFTKLYCEVCHLEWLKANPNQEELLFKRKSFGCLGSLSLMIMLPFTGGWCLYFWVL